MHPKYSYKCIEINGGVGGGGCWRVKKWKEIWQLAVCVELFQIIF